MESTDHATSLTPAMDVNRSTVPDDDPSLQTGSVKVGGQTFSPGAARELGDKGNDSDEQPRGLGGEREERSLSGQFGDVLDTQQSLVFGELAQADLRKHLNQIDEQIKTAQDNRSKLQAIIASAPPPPEYGTLPEIETEYSQQLLEIRQRVRELFNQVADKSQENARLLEEVGNWRNGNIRFI
eukprot:Gregarina_sp_Poly_1__10207@NODE_707_length_6679_cov_285_720357_g534_i0_p4_GENE_NODE_707_length_6679_cov_285_720357_g534_i0NODE_707_length_6679_cov_285_720357_g534_i0_p4_ORF_typecomplete_len183_score40_57FlgN/PF05130_12/0_00047DivIC/PF04977_15/2_5DivIC/PF04977_15/0_7MAP65_ASE1/PF03999_12/0_0013AAA_23/PF13476_6/0_0036CCDC154/PF15450_6/0_0079ALIX_LYPXL_bnd/PF13949_6/0_011UPF0242/PF06785_11/0_051Phage_HK97_TLTM/PF06120_11/0_072Vps53_N/PF04100_12/0_076Nnf1/PF03980_14/6_1e03Nnf1/PF03980_14/0_1DivIVA/P